MISANISHFIMLIIFFKTTNSTNYIFYTTANLITRRPQLPKAFMRKDLFYNCMQQIECGYWALAFKSKMLMFTLGLARDQGCNNLHL
jgi:hypothetical protein